MPHRRVESAARIASAAVLAALLAAATVHAQDALARGEELLEREEYVAAEAALREATAADPSSARAHGSLALALLFQGKLEEALEEGYLATSRDPGSPEARQIYSRALAAAGRPLEAARELEEVVAAKPDDPVALEALAGAYTAAHDDRALAAYENLLKLKPEASQVHVRLAEYLWATGQAERGNRVLADALVAFPDESWLHAVYGRALFYQDRVLDAVRELTRARDAGVTDLSTLTLLCYALWRAGDAEAAVAAFTAALEEHPGAGPLHEDLGRLLLSIGRPEAALVALEEAARRQPGQATAHLELGRAYEAVGRVAEAEQAYRKAIALGPQLNAPHYTLGRLLTLHGDREEGGRELALYRTKYEGIAHREQEARKRRGEINLAWAELRQGDAEAALARFTSLPESTETLIGQASALSRLLRHGDAVRVLERARELEPHNPAISIRLASERLRAEEKP